MTVATACEMAASGVPRAAANVVANGGAVYKGLVKTVSRKPDYEGLTEESLTLRAACVARLSIK